MPNGGTYRISLFAIALLLFCGSAIAQRHIDSLRWIHGGKHADDYTAVAMSSDYTWFATLGYHGEIKRWDAQTGAPLDVIGTADIHGLSTYPSQLLISHDSKRIFASLFHGTCVWDVETRRLLSILPSTNNSPRAMAESPDGMFFAQTMSSGSDSDGIEIFRRQSDSTYAVYGHTVANAIPLVSFTPDANTLIVAGPQQNGIDLFDLAQARVVKHLNAFSATVLCGTSSHDGHYLFVVGANGADSLYKIDLHADTIVRSVPVPTPDVDRCTISGNDSLLMLQFSSGVQEYSAPDLIVTSGTSLPEITHFGALYYSGDTILIGDQTNLYQVERSTNSILARIFRYYTIRNISVTPDGRYVAVTGGDNYIDFYDALSGKPDFYAIGDSISTTTFTISTDGTLLCTTGVGSRIRLYDLSASTLLRFFTPETNVPPSFYTSLALSRNNIVLAAGSRDSTITIFSVPNGAVLQRIHTVAIPSVLAFNTDATLLSAGCGDANTGEGEVFRVSDAARILDVPIPGAPTSVVWLDTYLNPDDSLIVSFDGTEGQAAYSVRTAFSTDGGYIPNATQGTVSSGNGRFVFGSCSDSVIRVIDRSVVNTPVVCTFGGYRQSLLGHISVSGNGSLLAAGAPDGTFMVWDIPDLEHASVPGPDATVADEHAILSLSPLPSDTYVTVRLIPHGLVIDRQSCVLTLTDMLGHRRSTMTVKTNDLFDFGYTISTHDLPSGTYILTLECDGGRCLSQPLLVNH